MSGTGEMSATEEMSSAEEVSNSASPDINPDGAGRLGTLFMIYQFFIKSRY